LEDGNRDVSGAFKALGWKINGGCCEDKSEIVGNTVWTYAVALRALDSSMVRVKR